MLHEHDAKDSESNCSMIGWDLKYFARPSMLVQPEPHLDLFWLVVWNMNFIVLYVGNVIIPTDFHIFQRNWNHQPVFSLLFQHLCGNEDFFCIPHQCVPRMISKVWDGFFTGNHLQIAPNRLLLVWFNRFLRSLPSQFTNPRRKKSHESWVFFKPQLRWCLDFSKVSHQIRHLSFGMQDAKGWAERHALASGLRKRLSRLRVLGEREAKDGTKRSNYLAKVPV